MYSSNLNFTREQTLALMKDRHLAVTANAGSGKTSVLVEKYLDLLMTSKHKNPVESIRSIVAITFTRQAASDMKAKITRKISERMLAPTLTSAELKKLKILRENISSAKVSTIHSFCNSLLKDYPIEAGISPVFRDMDEYEAEINSALAVDTILEEYSEALINNDTAAIKPEELKIFSKLLDNTGINSLRQMLLDIMREPVLLKNLIEFYNNEKLDLVEFYHNEFEKVLLENFRKFCEIFSGQINILDSSTKNYDEAFSIINEIELLLNNSNPDINEITFMFSSLSQIKAKGNSKIVNILLDLEFIRDSPEYKSNQKSFTNIIADSDRLKPLKDESIGYIELVKTFVNLADKANQSYLEAKNELTAYTFDDLLILTLELLNKPEVRDKIISGYEYLLVDEFQDTNQIQYDLVRNLVPGLTDSSVAKSPILFIVGDAKQSIYGFRSADVSVFNKAKEDIKAQNALLIDKRLLTDNPLINGSRIQTTHNESLGNISLADTFRLLPATALFVNAVCARLFDEKKSGIAYEPLVCGRKLISEISGDRELSPDDGTVRFVFFLKPKAAGQIIEEDSDEPEDSADFMTEAHLICNYIKRIVAGETDIRIYDGANYVVPQYKDIAILTRKKGSIQKLSPVLIESKIHFAVVSGKGFYQSQEVMDFTSLLNFIVNQNDDISLAGALKSPLFNVDDGELYNIALQSGSSLYDKLTVYSPSNGDSLYFIDRAKKISTYLIDFAGRASITELLLKIIEISDYYGAIEKFDASDQIKSNIKMFVQTAREFESKGYKSLYEFVTRAKSLGSNSNEAEAAFISGENVVSIMTTHAAKGLEFPVVILFDTNSIGSSDKGMIKSKNYGLSLPMKMPVKPSDDNKSYLETAATIPQYVIKRKKTEDDKAEEARLLYVAMTRAKDHLIISAAIKETKDSYSLTSNSFLSMILNSLNINIDGMINRNNVKISDKLKFTGKGEYSLELNLNIILNDESMKDLPFEADKSEAKPLKADWEYFSRTIEPDNRFDIVSATKYTAFLTDYNSFTNRYVLGLPDTDNIIISSRDEDYTDTGTDGAESGTILHRVLERINEWISEVLAGNYDGLSGIVGQTLFENYRLGEKELHDRVYNECMAVAKSDIIRENLTNLKFSEFEKTLNLPLEGSIITGNIDLLLKNHDSSLVEVWDWKSNYAATREDVINLGMHYEPQIKLYLFLISKLYRDRELYTGRLLFTRLAGTNDWTFEINMTRDDMNQFEKSLSEIIQKVKLY